MSISAYVRTIIQGVGETVDMRQTLSGSGGLVVEESIPDSTTDQLVSLAFILAELLAFYMVSDKALTIETNSSSAPQETISLAAGVPFVYVPGAGLASPFGGNVTALYATNASGSAAALQIRVLVDATP
jgi:hypothetical protein